MDAVTPWDRWTALIEPHYYADAPGKRGRTAKPVETMLRMYLLQVWFSQSNEGVEDAVYESYAMRRFMGLDFAVEQVPDATTLLHFRHLLERHGLGEQLFAAQNEVFEEQGWIMPGGRIVDDTISPRRKRRSRQASQSSRAAGEVAAELGYANRSGAWKAVQRALKAVQADTVEEYRAPARSPTPWRKCCAPTTHLCVVNSQLGCPIQ